MESLCGRPRQRVRCGGPKRSDRGQEGGGGRYGAKPPYSPDFNPIENAFAKLKALLRKAGERTVEGLWAAIGRLLDAFTPDECANYLAASGYDAT